ncbi:hypothetical protein D5018_12275 [Parashewanella curva]|uniref:MAE-28990/MAE-18760-like HEPN domain-containing protein n=1 Tax=Parashewanella curva TaxID=2338552 RepID=A0A3L8PZ86_9GAMM|nr:hypothetical protein [Parashewanella curva]RLV59402.1 hypothetical protein D5018_12275 [Parashewanella curva]
MTNKFKNKSFKPTVLQNHLTYPVSADSIKNRISVLKAVFNEVEETQVKYRDLLVKLDKNQQKLTLHDDSDEHYNYCYQDELIDLEFNFYRVNRISSILNMYAFLEHTLNRICHQKQLKYSLPISVYDLSGSGIERAKLYLNKFNLVNFASNICQSAWCNLTNLNKLRNALVHGEGDLDYTKKLKKEQIINIKGLDLHGSTILISNEYVIDALDNIEKFLTFVCEDSK